MTEPQLDKKIREEIRRRGGKVYKLHGTQFSMTGAPDLIGCLFNVPFAIEVKRPGGKATPKQQHELDGWAKQGWATGVATCVADAMQIIGIGPMHLQLTDAQRTRDVDKLMGRAQEVEVMQVGVGVTEVLAVKDGEIIGRHPALCECGRDWDDCSTRVNPEEGHYDR